MIDRDTFENAKALRDRHDEIESLRALVAELADTISSMAQWSPAWGKDPRVIDLLARARKAVGP